MSGLANSIEAFAGVKTKLPIKPQPGEITFQGPVNFSERSNPGIIMSPRSVESHGVNFG